MLFMHRNAINFCMFIFISCIYWLLNSWTSSNTFLVESLGIVFVYICIYIYIYIVVVKSLSRVQLFVTPWTAAHQAPQSMGFSRQEYWSGLPFPSPGDLPDPGIEPGSPALEADALTSEPPGKPIHIYIYAYTYIERIMYK